MKKKYIPLLVILLAAILLPVWKWNTWFGNLPEAPYSTPQHPDRILLTLGEEGESSRRISWRCDSVVSKGSVELVQENGSDTTEIEAKGTLVESRAGKSAFYRAELDGLEKGKSYTYRVTNGEIASAWYSFRTPADNDSLAFVYTGDIQDLTDGSTGEVFQNIHRQYPDIDFWALGGDVIERPMDEYWSYWHTTMDSIAGYVPFIAATGNHEYLKGLVKTLDSRWTHSFPNPENGPAGFEGRSYYVDLKNARYIVIDTDGIQGPLSLYRHWAWLKQTLASSGKRWKIVMMHHPVYSVREGRNNYYVRWTFKPLFEKYGADLVLQGHDHGYSRITTKSGNEKQAPVYIVSSASPKSYRIGFDPIHDREGSNLPLYQYITIQGDTLRFKAFTQEDNQLYDDLTLVRKEGKPSEVTDYAANWPESLTLPPSYEGNKKKAEKYRRKAEERLQQRLFQR